MRALSRLTLVSLALLIPLRVARADRLFLDFAARSDRRDALADLNGDGVVGGPDLLILAAMFGQPPGPSGLACAGSGALCTGP